MDVEGPSPFFQNVQFIGTLILLFSGVPLGVYWLATWPNKDKWKGLAGFGISGGGFMGLNYQLGDVK